MLKILALFLILAPSLALADTQLCKLLQINAPAEGGLTTNPDLIVVGKNQRKLMLFSKGQALKQYHISLGGTPLGTKEKSGDGKTPEGSYYVESKNPQSSYHLALRISYPSKRDLDQAKKMSVDPGGDIMIHGFPNDSIGAFAAFLLHNTYANWTEGCVAVTNPEIEEIFSRVTTGTPIEICP